MFNYICMFSYICKLVYSTQVLSCHSPQEWKAFAWMKRRSRTLPTQRVLKTCLDTVLAAKAQRHWSLYRYIQIQIIYIYICMYTCTYIHIYIYI